MPVLDASTPARPVRRRKIEMNPARIAVLAAILVGTSLQAGIVEAQRRGGQAAAGTPADRDRAREAYARGQEAFRTGDYDGAATAFREAYDAVPNPVVLLGLAEA